MKRTLLTCILTLTAATVINAQHLEWVKAANGGYTSGISITTDDFGNVYTTGQFSGTVDFDPGSETFNLTSYEGPNLDFFVQKLDPSGNLLWAKALGGAGNDVSTDIHLDSFGNVYISGFFDGTVDFNTGSGTANLTSGGLNSIFLLKLDIAGNFLLAKCIDTFLTVDYIDNNYVFMDIDAIGNIHLTGRFAGTVDFDPEEGTSYVTANGYVDSFMLKLDAACNFLWIKTLGNAAPGIDDWHTRVYPWDISLDPEGNVLTTGFFTGNVDFDPSNATSTLSASDYNNIFIHKLDNDGNFLWAKTMQGTGSAIGESIVTDMLGNLYITGYFTGTVEFDAEGETANYTSTGGSDVFILKLDASGNFLWIKAIGENLQAAGRKICIDEFSNIYTLGFFSESLDFNPGSGTTILMPQIATGQFLQKLDSSGDFLWAISLLGGYPSSSFGSAIDMHVDEYEKIYITGNFDGTVDFDPGTGTTYLSSFSGQDLFTLKLSPAIVGIDEQGNAIKAVVYPNPTRETVQIMFDHAVNNVELILTDATGKLISTQIRSVVQNTNIELPKTEGIYFLTIKTQESQNTIKLVKE